MLPARSAEILGKSARHSFRYSRGPFRRNLLIASLLTFVVYALVWLILAIVGLPERTLYALITGLVFFAFISFRMIRHYLANEVVLAIQPTGLYHAGWNAEVLPWETIKELTLAQRESEVYLNIELWPGKTGKPRPVRNINLSLLDGEIVDFDFFGMLRFVPDARFVLFSPGQRQLLQRAQIDRVMTLGGFIHHIRRLQDVAADPFRPALHRDP